MSRTEDDFWASIIQLLFIGFIVGFLVLMVKILSSFEVKYSKPYIEKTLEERLKMLPPSAKLLSDEAKLIFPEQFNEPKSFDFHWTNKTKKIEVRVPIEQLNDHQLKTTYLNRYLEKNWTFDENEYEYVFINQQSQNESCIDKHINENSNFRVVKFVVRGNPCW